MKKDIQSQLQRSLHFMNHYSSGIWTTPYLLLTVLLFSFGFSFVKSDKQEPNQIQVMSYNIRYGLGMDDKVGLPRIAKVISNEQPDIVGLQEIGNSTMAAELGRLTGMKFVFGPSLNRMDGYGDAILCKHPFEWVNNYSIPSASSSRYQAMGIDVDLSGIFGKNTKIRFINTHFDWLKTFGSQEARLATVEVIEKGFFNDSKSLPAILTGDLSAVPDSEPLKKLEQKGWLNENLGKELNTIRSTNPIEQIDYILIKPKKNWNVINVKVLYEPIASDHLPIVMTLELLND